MFKPNIEKMKIKNNVKGFMKTFKHPESEFISKAAIALGDIKDKSAIKLLIELN